MRRFFLIPVLFLFAFQPIRLSAQDFFVNADIVSSFMWRGLKCGDVCLQPSMGVNVGKFSFMAWGSTNLNTFGQDVDLFITYANKGLTLQFANYFVVPDSDTKFDYFDFKARTTNHMFDANISYQFSKKVPLTLMWSTFFAGNDYYNADGGRSYSSYAEISYPFTAKGINFNAQFGITPWEGMYADDFNVVNIALSMAKEIKITDKFSLPVFCKFIANPADKQTHVVFGLTFVK